MEIAMDITDGQPQASEKYWTADITIDGVGDVENYTIGELIQKLREVEAILLANTPSGENNEG